MNRFSFRTFSFLFSLILFLASSYFDPKLAEANESPSNSELISLTQSSDKLLLGFPNQMLINSVNRMGNFPTGSGYSPAITQNGKLACMWSVNQVLKDAGLNTLGNDTLLVLEARDELLQGRGLLVSQLEAKPGDLVIIDAGSWQQHIGICLNHSCTQVKSNSSYQASFSWISNSGFKYPGGPYNSGTPEFWRLKN
ncbi:MAG: hypothetical protein AAF298_15800 [Cyanobacteria bacterium P01_A01_bin.40]